MRSGLDFKKKKLRVCKICGHNESYMYEDWCGILLVDDSKCCNGRCTY